jgi:tryptophanyl-tRNA synthetase
VNHQSSDPAGHRFFSGIQPTGVPHLGNYTGAIRRWVELQEDFDAFVCVVDLHALTLPWDAGHLKLQSLETYASLLACGLDPARAVMFLQSQVRAHTELGWILTCLTRMGELRRMIQFKEKSRGETESVGAGLFAYPALQAADVLLYRAHGVPVGDDQRQHIELMRDLAGRFNSMFGDAFVLPEAWTAPEGGRIMALDDPLQKMSKSASRSQSSISLIDDPSVITKKVRAAVTDSGREVVAAADKPALTNLLTIFSAMEGSSVEELQARRWDGYGPFKAALAEAVVEHLAPIRLRWTELMSDVSELERMLAAGAATAAVTAEATMREVRALIGLVSPTPWG